MNKWPPKIKQFFHNVGTSKWDYYCI